MCGGRGEIVRSLAGHDRGAVFCVLESEGKFLLLVDGKERPIGHPKRKNSKHVEALGHFKHPVLERLEQGETVLDSELRRALAAFRDEWSRR